MSVELLDPLDPAAWPPGSDAVRAYLAPFARDGVAAHIANLTTRVAGVRVGDTAFPVTVNDANTPGNAYVVSPHSAYALYAKEELRLVEVGVPTAPLAALADLTGAVLNAARLDRVVHVNNWMLSTNLYGGWTGDGLAELTRALTERFPDHFLAFRSVNAWSDPALPPAFKDAGWRLAASRQVWVTDDVARDWRPRSDAKRDLKLMAGSGYAIEDLPAFRPGDARRIAELYAQLYLDKYSRLNPVFTPAWMEATRASGLIAYRGARGPDGRLDAVIGAFARGRVMTPPVVGYDTTKPPEAGLYRIASAMFARMAEERGLMANGSAGAAEFKRRRGARPVIEYTACYARHLSRPRRLALEALRAALDGLIVPLMRKNQL